MVLSTTEILVTVAALTVGTALTRFLPYFLFPSSRPTPKFIVYLGRVLPYAVMGFLVIFCLKDVSFTSGTFGLPELIAIACIALLHIWRGNTLLSIGAGTVIYMVLVQCVFV